MESELRDIKHSLIQIMEMLSALDELNQKVDSWKAGQEEEISKLKETITKQNEHINILDAKIKRKNIVVIGTKIEMQKTGQQNSSTPT